MSYAATLRGFFDAVVEDDEAPTDARAIYHDMYRVRLDEALAIDFPRLRQRLGDDGFATLAAAYRARYPSTTPSLRHYPRHLPRLVAERFPSEPALAELAALEWARVDVFDDGDEALLTGDTIAALTPDALVALPLRVITAHRLIATPHTVEAAWADPAADIGEARPGHRTLLVWRVLPNQVFHRRITNAERLWLRQLRRGTTLLALCEAQPAPPHELVARLQRFTADGLLALPPIPTALHTS